VRVVNPAYRATLENHFVLGQGASLITEYVLNLSQLLWNVECSALDPFIAGVVPHPQVLVNQVDLDQLGTLDGHVKGHRDDNLKDNNECPESEKSLEPWAVVVCPVVQEYGWCGRGGGGIWW